MEKVCAILPPHTLPIIRPKQTVTLLTLIVYTFFDFRYGRVGGVFVPYHEDSAFFCGELVTAEAVGVDSREPGAGDQEKSLSADQ